MHSYPVFCLKILLQTKFVSGGGDGGCGGSHSSSDSSCRSSSSITSNGSFITASEQLQLSRQALKIHKNLIIIIIIITWIRAVLQERTVIRLIKHLPISNPKLPYGVHKEAAFCLHPEPDKPSPLPFYLCKINFNFIPIYA